ncbi:DNA gyrase subunit A [Anaerolinea thermolimosa]|uniref:DNA topoisomerase (ATP-hydrolyzing) n=1 Tax=Anaerolinea thermolimosa TaxID=229919 RepID=UPI000780D306|nr:DNA topoisomerase (ATP-hydrolyzing) [Anaerolinea thermolimosa]GAP05746.1 DNA gyrase subunit A [Anaerolinea thermolimosa]
MEVGLVKRVDIDQEMQQAYLDYAMSVIVARALPDARDGLKPVQRRILYAMHDLNLGPDSTFKKSARVVGEVLGKYHPHGDVAVYEAMARLAQDFTMRYTLVDGQGNFGSIDGDPPAAMRYTEVRLTRFATELLIQLDRNTVDFVDNFDGTLREPEVLPAAIPNLLVNGASGIAVGMATSIPPHNLGEVIDALNFMLEEWERLDDVGVPDLMQFIKGPDFPTGGIILQEAQEAGLLSAYGSGKGRVTVRGRVHVEEAGRGRSRLIITELPYQVNKTSLIERIAELARDGSLDGISDLRDESDRQGMRIVIELKQGVEFEDTLRTLYQRTPLQTTLGITLLALVDGEPRLLNLKQALRVFLEHRLTVVRRRSEFDLARARHRAHILEGLRIALKNLDEIITLIRNSPDADQARTRLMKRFSLTEIQAQAILEMQLRRLASLERKRIEEEYKEVMALIKELETLLKSPKKMRQVVEGELNNVRQAYADRRRTQIVSLGEGSSARSLLTATDLTPAENRWVGITVDGKIGCSHGDTPPEGSPWRLVYASTHDTLYLVNRQGQASAVAVHSLPEVETLEAGVPFEKVSALTAESELAFLFCLPQGRTDETGYILTATRQGLVKKSALTELPGPSSQRFLLVRVNPDDELVDGLVTSGTDEVGLITAQGMAIRFSEGEVRPMGLVAAGVMGIKLGEGDAVTALVRWAEKAELALLASDGTGWRVKAEEFPLQGRYGQGVIACRPAKGSEVVGAVMGSARSAVMVRFFKGSLRKMKMAEFPVGKRGGKGTAVIAVRSGDEVVGMLPAEGQQLPSEEPVREKKRAKPAPTQAVSRRKKEPDGETPTGRKASGRKTEKTASNAPVSGGQKTSTSVSHTQVAETTEKPSRRRKASAEKSSEVEPSSTPSRKTRSSGNAEAPSGAPVSSRRKKPPSTPQEAEARPLPGLEPTPPRTRKRKQGLP